MIEKETISVIIPTHNRSNLLIRAIQSVLRQTMEVNEIIVVSDGSTDETDTVMANLSHTDERIKYICYYPGINGNHARNICCVRILYFIFG